MGRRLDTLLWSARLRWRAHRDRRHGPPRRFVRRAVTVLDRAEWHHRERRRSDPDDLTRHERQRFSQHGEDGLISAVLDRLGIDRGVAVEVGASDGTENCTRALVEDGWTAVWVEGDPDRAAHARAVTAGKPVTVVEGFVDRESVVGLLESAAVPDEPDVLVIDVDGNDWWLWRVIGRRFRPRVVVIEYNGSVGPRARWVMPYDPDHRWGEDHWHGAGLGAHVVLGRSLGFELVACDSHGVNAVFVRAEDARRVRSPARPSALWVPPVFSLPLGHPATAEALPRTTALEESDRPLVTLAVDRVPSPLSEVEPGQAVHATVTVRNGSDIVVSSAMPHPLAVAWWWEPAGRAPRGRTSEPSRATQRWAAEPGSDRTLALRAAAPREPGPSILVAALVQEGVAWLDDFPGGRVEVGTWTVAG